MKNYKKAPMIERIRFDLDTTQKQNLYHTIDNLRMTYENDRQEWYERQQEFLAHYDDFLTYVRKGPWDNCANINLPFTAIMVKEYYTRFYNMFSNPDIFTFAPRRPMSDKVANAYKRLFNWYVFDYINEFRGIRGFISEICFDVASVGFGCGWKDWLIRQDKIIDIELNEKLFMDEMAEMGDQIEQSQEPVSISKFKEVFKLVTKFEGTRVRSIPYENILFPNLIHECNNMNEPKMVLIDSDMSRSDLKLKSLSEVYDPEAVEKVLMRTSNVDMASRQAQARDRKAELSGYNEHNTRMEEDGVTLQHAFIRYDIDEDGIDEDVVVTIAKEAKEILQVTPLQRLCPTGLRPVFKWDCFTKPRQAYARGVPEVVYSVQKELNLTHNMRLDYLQLQTCPFFTYRESSNLRDQKVEIAPGKGIPVAENDDLQIKSFNVNATVLASEEALMWNYGTQMVSVTPSSQGFVGDSVGATRSTSGVVTLLNQVEKQMRPVIENSARTWREFVFSMLEDLDFKVDAAMKIGILDQEMPDVEMLFTDTRAKTLNEALQVRRNMDISIDVASIIHSEEVRRNNAFQILQISMSAQPLMAMGIVTPETLYNAYNDWLSTFTYINPERFSFQPQGMVQKPLTLNQEIQYIYTGMVPPMSLMDNHPLKAQLLQQYMASDVNQKAIELGRTAANVMDVFGQTINRHIQMAQQQGLPNVTGDNQQDMTALMSGTAPQQRGGQNESFRRANTGSSEQTLPTSRVEDSGGAGGEPNAEQQR